MKKLIKGVFITVGGLVVIYLVLCLIAPSEVTVTREAEMSAPADSVYAQVMDFSNWPKWDPWTEKDPEMERTYGDVESGTGAQWCWNSENEDVGQGCLKIMESIPSREIHTELRFEGMDASHGHWTFHESEGVTHVSWSMKSELPFLIRPMGWMFDSWMGPDFEKGLSNLKKLVEG